MKMTLRCSMLEGLCTIACMVIGQMTCAQTLFHRSFVHGYPPDCERVLQLPSGSFILFGGGGYPGAGSIAKLDAFGTLQWQERIEFPAFGGNGAVITSARLDAQGMLACSVAGEYPSHGAILRMDTNGTVLWTLLADHPFTDLVITADGNYATLGRRNVAAGASPWDIHFMKIAPDGTVMITKRYPASTPGVIFNVADKTTFDLTENTAGDFLLSYGYEGKVGLLKISAAGAAIWNKYYWQNTALQPYVFQYGNNWNLVEQGTRRFLIGKGDEAPGTPEPLVVIKIDDNGAVIDASQLDVPGGACLNEVFTAADSSIHLFARLLQDPSVGDHAFVHLDVDGGLLGAWRVGAGSDHWTLGAGVDPDGGFDLLRAMPDTSMTSAPDEIERMGPGFVAECDATDQPVFTSTPLAIIVLDTIDLFDTGEPVPPFGSLVITPGTVVERDVCQVVETVGGIQEQGGMIAPDPTNDWITIRVPGGSGPEEVEVLDGSGRCVLMARKPCERIDLSTLSPGLYHVIVTTTEGRMWGHQVARQ